MAGEAKKILREIPYPYNLMEVVKEKAPLGVDDSEWDIMDYTPRGIMSLINETLNDRERQIMEMRFRDNKSEAETGKSFGVSRERIRQIESRAIQKIYNPGAMQKYASVPYYEWLNEKAAKEKAEERLDMLLSNGDYVRRAAPPPQADVTIDELFNNGMSLRSFNCLRRAGLNTAGDIIKQGEASLMRIEHLGRKSFNEIVKLMHQLGLRMSWE